MTMITPNSATTPKRGAFILLEGVDRCGKTTQVGLLVKHLLSLSLATGKCAIQKKDGACVYLLYILTLCSVA